MNRVSKNDARYRENRVDRFCNGVITIGGIFIVLRSLFGIASLMAPIT